MLPAHTGIMPISVHERGLAHAIATDEDDDLARRHVEIDSVECLALPVTCAQTRYVQHVRCLLEPGEK